MGLLATDLDGTFIGDDGAMLELWRELDARGIVLVFATGRHLRSVRDFYMRVDTSRRAAACICMVGTEVWRLGKHGYEIDTSWREQVAFGWDRTSVAVLVREVLTDAELQPEEWQSPLKISYFVDGPTERDITDLRAALALAGLEAKVIFSGDRFVDVLPGRSGKGDAVSYVAALHGLSPGEVIVAGDTGNDLDMMRPELGFRAIAVGNAASELARYRAPGLYHASASFAKGIREGLVHHGWLED